MKKAVVAFLASMFAVVAPATHAADITAFSGGAGQVLTDAEAMFTAVAPISAGIIGIFLVWKIGKRFLSKTV